MSKLITRRDFLVQSGLVSLSAASAGCVTTLPKDPITCNANQNDAIIFQLVRPADRLYLNVVANGFFVKKYKRKNYLVRHPGCPATLSFQFPSQHYPETTVEINDVSDVNKLEEALNRVRLFSSSGSKIVFEIPKSIDKIELSIKKLLTWDNFSSPEISNPKLQGLEEFSKSDAVRRKLLGFNWWTESFGRFKSTIELPWGVFLQPLDLVASDVRWRHRVNLTHEGSRHEIWHTMLESRIGRHVPVPMEILDISGFESIELSARKLKVQNSAEFDHELDCTATTNFDRLELLTSLSRRFPYFPISEQQNIEYIDRSNGNLITSLNSCYAVGRSIEAYRYGLSSLGGFLDLRGEWSPENSCALQSWTQVVHLGRDQEVKFERKGWLYPLGIPAVLVIRSDRRYLKDVDSHYVAPLVKQAFLTIPLPNEITLTHPESPFKTISILTATTPALDTPPSGNSSDYATYVRFLPKVDGRPFVFDISAVDQNDITVTTTLSCHFVSNRALNENGLIKEPGYPSSESAPLVRNLINSCGAILPEGNTTFGSKGLWELDEEWMSQSLRFAEFSLQKVALAPSSVAGKTVHEVEWMEIVRGQQPRLIQPSEEEQGLQRPAAAPRPFEPRIRTMKIALQSVRQFSGQDSFVLATYRNLALNTIPLLDPLPTDHVNYTVNVLDPTDEENEAQTYLQILQIQSPNQTEVSIDIVANAYYFHLSTAERNALLGNLNNSVRFGVSANTEASGGLATPDTPVGLLSQKFGVLGDPLMDPSQASNVDANRLKMLDHWTSIYNNDPKHLYDPLVTTVASTSLVNPRVSNARTMGSIASMFGLDAEIIPGIRLNRVLEAAGLDLGSESREESRDAGKAPVSPFAWDFKVTGLDGLLELIGNGVGQIGVNDFLVNLPVTEETGEKIQIGIEASVNWTTDGLNNVDLGIIKFIPKTPRGEAATFEVNAVAKSDLIKKETTLDASAQLSDFNLEVLESIDVGFQFVSFHVNADGTKNFEPKIGDVEFKGALSFISNLKDLFGELEDALGLKIDLSPERVEIGQTITIPPTVAGEKPQPLYIGPALIENLTFKWGIILPLLGRSPLLFYFGFASREQPFTISIIPYGGKSHALIEATTRGLRLFEASMEYGGVVSVNFSIASGQVSLTAGMLFRVKNENGSKTTTFAAFVKLTGCLDVAGIITFSGLIQVTLGYTSGGDGSEIRGTALVRVSMKIGFIRLSYEFSADHVEKRGDGVRQFAAQAFSSTSKIANSNELLSYDTDISAYQPFEFINQSDWNDFVEGYA